MPPLGHFSLRFEWLPAGTDGWGEGQGRKRSALGNALDTAVPNDPASFAPYLLARGPFARGHTPRLGGIRFETRYRAGYKRMTIQCHRALILGRGAKECHSVMVPGGDAPFVDIMTVQDLRLEIRRDGTAAAAIPTELSVGCGLLYSGHELS